MDPQTMPQGELSRTRSTVELNTRLEALRGAMDHLDATRSAWWGSDVHRASLQALKDGHEARKEIELELARRAFVALSSLVGRRDQNEKEQEDNQHASGAW